MRSARVQVFFFPAFPEFLVFSGTLVLIRAPVAALHPGPFRFSGCSFGIAGFEPVSNFRSIRLHASPPLLVPITPTLIQINLAITRVSSLARTRPIEFAEIDHSESITKPLALEASRALIQVHLKEQTRTRQQQSHQRIPARFAVDKLVPRRAATLTVALPQPTPSQS